MLLFAVSDWGFFGKKKIIWNKRTKGMQNKRTFKNIRNMFKLTWDSKMLQGERFSSKIKLPVRDTSKTLPAVNRHLRKNALIRQYYTIDIHRNWHLNHCEMRLETILNMFWTKTSGCCIKQLKVRYKRGHGNIWFLKQ